MTKRQKLLEQLLNFPAEMRYSDIKKILESFGYQEDNGKGSHFVFRQTKHEPITVSKKHGKMVKRYQLKDIAKALGLEEQ
jgi:predicted RNA binding protein YcfA (HicA-like mRNA interferase family)